MGFAMSIGESVLSWLSYCSCHVCCKNRNQNIADQHFIIYFSVRAIVEPSVTNALYIITYGIVKQKLHQSIKDVLIFFMVRSMQFNVTSQTKLRIATLINKSLA